MSPAGCISITNVECVTAKTWTADGKIRKIEKERELTNGVQTLYQNIFIEFYYDAMGNRVSKLTYIKPGDPDQCYQLFPGQEEFNECIDCYFRTLGLGGTYYARDANGKVMAVYRGDYMEHPTHAVEANGLALEHWNIYGNAGQDIIATRKPASDSLYSTDVINLPDKYFRKIGWKHFEIKDHLGNVRVVISDIKQPLAEPPGDYFDPDILAVNNHYPFGMLQPGRYWERGWSDSLGHRYGFNGMERDDDIMESRQRVNEAKSGAGNSYTTQFRQFDPRTGRWWSRDPVFQAWQSTYSGLDNNPILFTDTKGDRTTKDLEKNIENVNNGYNSLYEKVRKKYLSAAKGDCQSLLDEMSQIALEKAMFNMKMNQLRRSDQLYDMGKYWTKEDLTHQKKGVWGRAYSENDILKIDALHGTAIPRTGNTDAYYQEAIYRHELEHLWQYEVGLVSFQADGIKGGVLYDIFDELTAFKSMHIFNVRINIRSINDIYNKYNDAYGHLSEKQLDYGIGLQENISIYNAYRFDSKSNKLIDNLRLFRRMGEIFNENIPEIKIGQPTFEIVPDSGPAGKSGPDGGSNSGSTDVPKS